MLSIKEIENFYPPKLQNFKRSLLREYLQYKILQIVFNSEYAPKLSFLGGTALRIVYGNNRFSEDLDFDNFSLTEKEFIDLSKIVKEKLELEGYKVEIRNVSKGAFRCYLKIPRLLFDSELSGYKDEKILIQLDSMAHHFDYKPDKKILNSFDVFEEIYVTPLDVILSQKILTIFNRKRMKGRDFYDVVFLLSLVGPNYEYLKQKTDINNGKELKRALLEVAEKADLKKLSDDVSPFLFNSEESKKVTLFEDYIKSVEL